VRFAAAGGWPGHPDPFSLGPGRPPGGNGAASTSQLGSASPSGRPHRPSPLRFRRHPSPTFRHPLHRPRAGRGACLPSVHGPNAPRPDRKTSRPPGGARRRRWRMDSVAGLGCPMRADGPVRARAGGGSWGVASRGPFLFAAGSREGLRGNLNGPNGFESGSRGEGLAGELPGGCRRSASLDGRNGCTRDRVHGARPVPGRASKE